MVDVVKKGINPQLPQLTPILMDEINYAFQVELGNFTGWKEVTAMSFFGSVAHRTATRVMICAELCRDEKFIRLSMDFVMSIFVTALVIVKLPLGPLRGLLAWPLSLLHRWKLHRCHKILLPIVHKRMATRGVTAGKTIALPVDAIEWTLAFSKPDSPHNTPEMVTTELLHNLWAGSSAPGGLMTELVYQLLLEPKYLERLREEASNALKAHGWSEKALDSLYLQDSFIREVNRLYPTGSVTCSRTVLDTPFQFHDGLTLPIGSRFGFPIKALQSDPDNFDNPDTFDGFRFAKPSTSESSIDQNNRRWGAASMGTTNLAWGYGNHVCPGRFFAVREVKMVFTKLILEYDIKWSKRVTVRPKPVHIEGQFIPNMGQRISLRRRVVGD
ncbi:MAG: hypothetical protein MMC33_002257 [Icmadophila ericetorum]|nr:hypothetical protein [Icmadophila ericetorum]